MTSNAGRDAVLTGVPDPHKMAIIVRLNEADIKSMESAGNVEFVTGGQEPVREPSGQLPMTVDLTNRAGVPVRQADA